MEFTDVFFCKKKIKNPHYCIRSFLKMGKPNFFIVGAPKCGTTAMNDYLNQHPAIFMATKELHYFGRDLKLKNKISEAEYLKHFTNAGNKKIIGEASVWYLYSKTAAHEIKSFSP